LIGLIEGLPGQYLLANKAYHSDVSVQEALEKGMEVVIPPKANRKEKRPFDTLKNRARHLVVRVPPKPLRSIPDRGL
jgi:hypothetical protein